jgi:glucose/mannose transport system permease protein
MKSFENVLPKLVIAPGFVLGFAFIYGLMIWNGVLSVTNSRMLPNYDEFVGLEQYAHPVGDGPLVGGAEEPGHLQQPVCRRLDAAGHAAGDISGPEDSRRRLLRTIYLYPMALSFIVTGTAWKWILNPSLGLEKLMHDLGWASELQFSTGWCKADMAIYCVVIAGVWQSAGFVMALFLAGLRGIDDSIIKAAQIDGASLPRIYWRIIIPSLRPVVFSTHSGAVAPVDQEFRPGDGAHRRRPRLCHRRARHLHVHHEFHPRPDRPGRSLRHHDAGHRGGDRRALPVQRAARQAAER